MVDWKTEALELAHSKPEWSWRKIAKVLGVPKSTVSDFLRMEFKGYRKPSEKNKVENLGKSPIKILFLDIEITYLNLASFGIFNQHFGLDNILEDWSLLSFSYKWFEDEEAGYLDIIEHTEKHLLEKLHSLLSEADFVVGHNYRKFDNKKIKTRMIVHGMRPFPPPRIIDTYEIARREFGFTSNKLAYLTKLLCKRYIKSSHENFHGIDLWKEFLRGNKEAIKEMREYNQLDVLSLQELWEILEPWDTKSPNFELYFDEVVGKDSWEKVGHYYTNLSKFEMFQNKNTGKILRGRSNTLTKEKMKSLFANIV